MIRKNLTKQNVADKNNLKLGFSKEESKMFVESFFSIIKNHKWKKLKYLNSRNFSKLKMKIWQIQKLYRGEKK